MSLTVLTPSRVVRPNPTSGVVEEVTPAADVDVAAAQSTANAAGAAILAHAGNTSNPHNVTAAQTGAYTAAQVDTALNAKLNASAVSTFVLTLLDDADAAAVRTTLGLGTAASAVIGTSAGNVAVLDVGGVFPETVIPHLFGSTVTFNNGFAVIGGTASLGAMSATTGSFSQTDWTTTNFDIRITPQQIWANTNGGSETLGQKVIRVTKGSNTEVAYIQQSGDAKFGALSCGTFTPTSMDLLRTNTSSATLFTAGTRWGGQTQAVSVGANYDYDGVGQGAAYIWTSTGKPLVLGVNGIEKGRISSAGNWLFGTPTDDLTNKLQVNGSAAFADTITAKKIVRPTGYAGLHAARLPKWRKALADLHAGTRDIKIALVGDSLYWGYGSGDASYPTRNNTGAWLAKFLNARGVPAATGFVVPERGDGSFLDARWSIGSWTRANWGVANQAAYQAANGTAGTLSCSPCDGYSYDRADVYYVSYSNNASLTAGFFGNGSTTTQATNDLIGFIGKLTASATTPSTTPRIDVTQSGSNNTWMTGIDLYHSTTRRCRIGTFAVPGATTSDQSFTGDNWHMLGMLRAYQPDLTIILLGFNDAGASVTTSTVNTNMANLIVGAQLWGDVMIGVPHPPNPASAGAYANVTNYTPTFYALAETYGCLVSDYYLRDGSYTSTLMTDALHRNTAGYLDWARMLDQMLFMD